MTPFCLDKPILMAASTTYAEKLKLRTSCTTTATNHSPQFTHPPKAKIHCPEVSFDALAFPPLNQSTTKHAPNQSATPPAETVTTQPATTYDDKADLQRITMELESTLKTKFEKTLTDLDEKFEKWLKALEDQFTHQFKQLEPLAINQAELKATQSNQAHDISQITKNMSTLMSQVSSILDRLSRMPIPDSHLTLATSIGRS